jgi:tetratricopeptide (TPR) repeat protein
LPHIKVIARSSVFRYKNQTPDLQQVARQLNVQALLTGRVLAQGDTLGVSVELMDAQNNTQLWGQHYTRKAADILAVQDEIARQVTDTLRVRLTGGQQEQVTKRYTENTEAYRLYLQGRYYMNEGSEETLNRAIPFFDQAIALDPRYALAYSARGESFFEMGDLSLPMSEAKPKAKQDIAAALSIDDKLVEARTTLANIEFQYDWNFARAEEDFKQVIALNPNYAEAHHQYTYYLSMTGRPMEGVAEIKLAQQLDPVNPSINVDVCLPSYLARQFDQSIAQSRKAVEMFPNFFLAHMALGVALFEKGDISAGIEELEKAKAIEPTPLVIGNLGYAYAKSGRKDEARKLLADLKEQSKGRYVASYWIAMIYVGLEEKDEAFAWFEKAYQEHSWWLIWLKMDPKVDSLRSDSRFLDLMRRIGFPQ